MESPTPRQAGPVLLGPLVGSIAASVAIGSMFALAEVTQQPSLAETLAEAIVSLTPLPVVEAMINRFGSGAKLMLLLSVILGQIAVGGGLGLLFERRRMGNIQRGMTLAITAAVVSFGLLPAVGAGVLGTSSRAGAAATSVSVLVAGATFGLVFAGLWAALHPSGTFAEEDATARRILLRNALLVLAGSFGGLGVVRWLIDVLSPPPVPPVLSSEVARTNASLAADVSLEQALEMGVPGLAPEITPNQKFYTVSKNVFRDPTIGDAAWRLDIAGLVDRPFSLTYPELKALPAATQLFTLLCISNEVGGDLIGNAAWRGVSLAELLRRAGVQSAAVDVIVRAADDYADSIPIQKALQPETMLVYEMNGVVLPKEHGFPVRLLVPDIYGMKNVKWVTGIEVIEYDFKGYWQRQGWSDVATINTTSRIDIPRNASFLRSGPNFIGGIAHAGQRGIQGVEVSHDGGRAWEPAVIKAPLGPNAWSLWLYRWNTPDIDPGQKLLVRAIDGTGTVQSAEVRDALPDGASGYHAVSVRRAKA